MYVVAHSLQPTACIFSRIDYICVNHVCVCICERVDHIHRAQVLRGVKLYLKLITIHCTHAQWMATHDCTRTYTCTHFSPQMYSDTTCSLDTTAREPNPACRTAHTRISLKPSSERLAKASQPSGRYFIMHGMFSLADVVKSLGHQRTRFCPRW